MNIQIASFFFLRHGGIRKAQASKHVTVCVREDGGGEVKGRAAVSSCVLLAMPACITFQTNVHTLIVICTHTGAASPYLT